jgi:hypothetical protein
MLSLSRETTEDHSMRRSALGSIAVPVLIITVGVGALLSAMGVGEGVDWIWSLGLAVVGVFALASGVDKVTAVVGPFLVFASIFSVLRQTGRLSVNLEMPMLVIVFGVLMLIARIAPIPTPTWLLDAEVDKSK